MPRTAVAGELIELRTLVAHPMHTGFQVDARGQRIARDIITTFTCRYGGAEVFRAEFFPAISANPYLTFHLRAVASGPVTFKWIDQDGVEAEETRDLSVEG